MKEFVEDQVRQGGYSTPSEYVRDLLRRERKRQADEELERLLLEGLKSGNPVEVNQEFWERKRQELARRAGK